MSRPITSLHSRYQKLPDSEGGCWLWLGGLSAKGYGLYKANALTKTKNAHKAVYENLIRILLEGETLNHICKNRACVNPSHLEVTTLTGNNRDTVRVKLSLDKVRNIRELHSNGSTIRGLSLTFNVDPKSIRMILSGESWKEGVV